MFYTSFMKIPNKSYVIAQNYCHLMQFLDLLVEIWEIVCMRTGLLLWHFIASPTSICWPLILEETFLTMNISLVNWWFVSFCFKCYYCSFGCTQEYILLYNLWTPYQQYNLSNFSSFFYDYDSKQISIH